MNMQVVYLLGAAIAGLLTGSVMNMMIHRLPRMLSGTLPSAHYNLAWPRSHCPHCQQALRWWHLLPLAGYLLLWGRCGHCGHKIAWRYPLVEILMAAATVLLAWKFGHWQPWLATSLLTGGLLTLAAIDLESGLLPDDLTLPLLWLGLLVNMQLGLVPLADAVLGAVFGYLFLWLVYWGHFLLTGRQGLGYGDFKLLAALGAWGGWQCLPQVLLLAALGGLVVALLLLATGRMTRQQAMPFGPFLALAGWLLCLWPSLFVVSSPW